MPQNLKYIMVARYPTTVTEDYYSAGFLMTAFFFYKHTDTKKIFLTHRGHHKTFSTCLINNTRS